MLSAVVSLLSSNSLTLNPGIRTKLNWPSIASFITAPSADVNRVRTIGKLLIILQIMDGLLTYSGVSRFGSEAEGNPLLRSLIEAIGVAPTLLSCKVLAILLVLCLMSLKTPISWLRMTMGGVMLAYALFAVIPWAALFIIC